MKRENRRNLPRLFAALGFGAIALLSAAPAARGQAARKEPHIGYLYPAGARQGTTVRVFVGGQNLRELTGTVISGKGVRAEVVQYLGRTRRLNGDLRRELGRRLLEACRMKGIEPDFGGPGLAKLLKARARRDRAGGKPSSPAEGAGDSRKKTPRPGTAKEKPGAPAGAPAKKDEGSAKLEKLYARLPTKEKLATLTRRELAFVANTRLRFDRKRQPNAQLEETAVLEVTVDPDAEPGDREVRVLTPLGITNPLCFQVGTLPEVLEEAPYDPAPRPSAPVTPPVVLNGQIRPGDVDRFRIRAQEGQDLVIRVQARHIMPYLADAVPGWFQAVLTLYGPDGREAAYADDFRFDPDPVLHYTVPESGVYELEIRDAIYRGREDFVYRITVGEEPFVTGIFPLGGREGKETAATVYGWNLPARRVLLDTRPGMGRIREAVLEDGAGRLTNAIQYAVSDLPEVMEKEPNTPGKTAQAVSLPCTVNGRIDRPGDMDAFRFEGRAGDEVVAEIEARVLGSPLDSLVRLRDEHGNVVAWSDDHEDVIGYLHRNAGLVTHHADAYLRARLDRAGTYTLEVSDAQHHGGEAYAYRMRVSPPQPDFELLVSPPSLTLHPGVAVPITAHVLRQDGFDGPVEVRLRDDPYGFDLEGRWIPAGCKEVRMTLAAPLRPVKGPVRLAFEGRAEIGGRRVVRAAVPAENLMQAFLYRHLVPRRELVAVVQGARRFPPLRLAGTLPVKIPAGGTAEVRVRAPSRRPMGKLALVLDHPPEGLTLENVIFGPEGATLRLRAEGDAMPAGTTDNLIVAAFVERPAGGKGGKGDAKKRNVPVGVLPAIPIEIVKK